jgi:hypothetical protein
MQSKGVVGHKLTTRYDFHKPHGRPLCIAWTWSVNQAHLLFNKLLDLDLGWPFWSRTPRYAVNISLQYSSSTSHHLFLLLQLSDYLIDVNVLYSTINILNLGHMLLHFTHLQGCGLCLSARYWCRLGTLHPQTFSELAYCQAELWPVSVRDPADLITPGELSWWSFNLLKVDIPNTCTGCGPQQQLGKLPHVYWNCISLVD